MSVHRYTALLGYGFLRLCVALRGLSFYHIRVLWHGLRHGGWKSLQDEIFPPDAVMPPVVGARPTTQPDGGQRKGILVIDRSLPRFDRDAGSRATWQYIRLLREMGFRVTVWGHDFLRREPYATMLEDMGVEVVSGGALVCGRWRGWVRARAATLDYVIIHRPNVAVAYVDFLRKATDARILYFGVDLRWLRNLRRHEVERDPFHLAEARYWQAIENRLVGMAHAAYFYSRAESDIVVQQVPDARVRTVPLFIFQGKAEEGRAFGDREGLIFVGGFAHQPNVDGILWFVNDIYPAVRERLGEVTLQVVGANPPEALRGRPGVVLAGAVSDAELQALYGRSRVVVAPLRYGAGIKGKIVEAVFQRVPLVTTTIGSEGMPEPEGVLEVRDQPHDFATAVIRLYRDEDLWSARSARMGAYVAEHFSAATARRVLEEDISP
jgi:glycosyltransferase involved in cell wall biosynthesis